MLLKDSLISARAWNLKFVYSHATCITGRQHFCLNLWPWISIYVQRDTWISLYSQKKNWWREVHEYQCIYEIISCNVHQVLNNHIISYISHAVLSGSLLVWHMQSTAISAHKNCGNFFGYPFEWYFRLIGMRFNYLP